MMTEAEEKEILEDCEMSLSLQAFIQDTVIPAVSSGDDSWSWERLGAEFDRIAQEHGHHGGIPMPAMDVNDNAHPMVLARRSPLGRINRIQYHTEMSEQLSLQHIHVRNSWERLGDETVSIVDTTEGPMALTDPHGGRRLRKLLADMMVRGDCGTMTAEQELKALDTLKPMLKHGQWNQYVLNGLFPETSKRSGVVYVFRKGRPTLACSWHGDNDGRVIAGLCLHPMGYYRDTHVGVMTPTDEVIAALTLMRGDEHCFWKKSGQWSAVDPRSGL